MKSKLLLVLAAWLLAVVADGACAQNITQSVGVCDPAGYVHNCVKPNADGSVNITGSFSATLSGFTPNGNVASLAVTTSSANVALPAGTVLAVLNSGAADVALKMSVGAGSAATTDFVLKSGATVGLTPGSNTYINAITASGSSSLSIAGGAGLVTGYGGGGSGGSGGAVTNAGTFAVQLTGATQNTNLANIDSATSRLTSSATNIAPGTALATTSLVVGSRYKATPPTFTDGQEGALQIDSTGNLKVNVTNNGVAQGAAIAGQTPSTVSGQSLTANPSAYSTATTNPVTLDEYGAVLTRPYSLSAALVQGTTSAMTGTTSTSLVAAPGASLRNYITNLTCVNSHATVGTFVTVQDGSGGTALYTLAAAAVFGGAAITFPAPLRQPTANTAIYVANVTTGASVICSATGYKAP